MELYIYKLIMESNMAPADTGQLNDSDEKVYKCHLTTKVSLSVRILCDSAYHDSEIKPDF